MISKNKLQDIRSMQGWSQQDIANVIGVSRPTYANIESGEASMTLHQLEKLANKLGYTSMDIITDKVLDEEVYKSVVMEFLNSDLAKDGRVTKTKLAKLIYLADFAWYYIHLESITGAQYRKLAQGPVPNYYFGAIDMLFDEGLIAIDIKDQAMLIHSTQAGKLKSGTGLDQSKIDLIHAIACKWKNASTKEIVAFSHEQLPWKVCSEGEVIPYDIILQQEPEYVF